VSPDDWYDEDVTDGGATKEPGRIAGGIATAGEVAIGNGTMQERALTTCGATYEPGREMAATNCGGATYDPGSELAPTTSDGATYEPGSEPLPTAGCGCTYVTGGSTSRTCLAGGGVNCLVGPCRGGVTCLVGGGGGSGGTP
jgi:hypothetical protein